MALCPFVLKMHDGGGISSLMFFLGKYIERKSVLATHGGIPSVMVYPGAVYPGVSVYFCLRPHIPSPAMLRLPVNEPDNHVTDRKIL